MSDIPLNITLHSGEFFIEGVWDVCPGGLVVSTHGGGLKREKFGPSPAIPSYHLLLELSVMMGMDDMFIAEAASLMFWGENYRQSHAALKIYAHVDNMSKQSLCKHKYRGQYIGEKAPLSLTSPSPLCISLYYFSLHLPRY